MEAEYFNTLLRNDVAHMPRKSQAFVHRVLWQVFLFQFHYVVAINWSRFLWVNWQFIHPLGHHPSVINNSCKTDTLGFEYLAAGGISAAVPPTESTEHYYNYIKLNIALSGVSVDSVDVKREGRIAGSMNPSSCLLLAAVGKFTQPNLSMYYLTAA